MGFEIIEKLNKMRVSTYNKVISPPSKYVIDSLFIELFVGFFFFARFPSVFSGDFQLGIKKYFTVHCTVTAQCETL